VHKIWQEKYDNKRKGIRRRKEEDLVPRVQDRRKKTIVKLGYNSMAQRDKSTAKQYMGRSSGRYSKKGE